MIGRLLDGRYRIKKLLGKGGFGHTYLAEDTKRPGNPPCVVKHLRPRSNNPEFLAVARRLFATEAETLEKLGDLDQVPRLYAYFEEDEQFYLVQEFIDGRPLSEELEPNKPWDEPQVIDFLQNILSILVVLHKRGVIHRDIKPENIMRRHSDRKLVLIDFGAVKQVMQDTDDKSNVSVAIGTSGYIPAEQAQGKPKFASDIYAVGMVAIQALTGVPPSHFGEDSQGEVQWQMCVDMNLISPNLVAILEKMVKRDYRQRFATAEEVLQALEVSTLDIAPHPPTEVSEKRKLSFPSVKSLGMGALAVAILLSVVGGLFVAVNVRANACRELRSCRSVTKGSFRFSSGASWQPVRERLEKELKTTHPELIFAFVKPIDGQPSSGKAIEMLLDGEIDFALISRPLEQEVWDKAKARGIELHQEKVAIGGLAVAVHPSVNIPGLTLEQIQNIYLGKIKNWREVGGNDLEIKPIVRPSVLDGGAKSILGHGIRSHSLPLSVTRVKTAEEGIDMLKQRAGSIFWASLGLMSKACEVKIIPIGLSSGKLVSPVLNNDDCPRKANIAALINADYPVTSFMVVAFKKNDKRSLEAGTAYAKLLRTKEGQQIFTEEGYVSLN
ncbi:MAG: serine/threonine-protein kinase [Pseudanabaenaceae cyanobacterium SKYGB_i_bin29]|nr:serine/threonine-protein kinase [Pseudanabaenaceae cyanobacterium SKYG29]MDW8422503.1 serine/threonine-protein kinase [Pseudanabaenaceae cyanobacterium SKYGB_i_bin29]